MRVQYFALIWRAVRTGHRTQHPDTNLRHHDDVGALKRAQSEMPLQDQDIFVSDGSVPKPGTRLDPNSGLGPRQIV